MPPSFRTPLWIAIAPRFKFMFLNVGGYSNTFCDLAPDDPLVAFSPTPCLSVELSQASSCPYNMLGSFAPETSHALNPNKSFFNSMCLSVFPLSPSINYDVDSDVITKIPNGSDFHKIDVCFSLRWGGDSTLSLRDLVETGMKRKASERDARRVCIKLNL